MTMKQVTVRINHTFELDIPDELLDEDGWDLDYYIYDAFENEDWQFSDMIIREPKPKSVSDILLDAREPETDWLGRRGLGGIN